MNAASKMDLPLGTPAHASHLPLLDMRQLIGTGAVLELPLRTDRKVLSTSTCDVFKCQTFGELLSNSLRDITAETLNFSGLDDYFISSLGRDDQVHIHPFGPTSQVAAFQKALEAASFQTELVMNLSDNKLHIAYGNSDISGGNTCSHLEDDPEGLRSDGLQDIRSYYTVVVSAQTPETLRGNIEHLANYLHAHPDVSIADVAYTSTAGRTHQDLRRAYTVNTVAALLEGLQSDLLKDSMAYKCSNPPFVVFTFGGHSSQYSSMAKQLFKTCGTFRDSVQSFHEIAMWQGFSSFLHIFTNSDVKDIDSSFSEVQLSIVVSEMSLISLWKSWSVKPDLVVGHSLGEYSALYAAGVLSAYDVLFLVGHRARLVEEACDLGAYSTLAIQTSAANVAQIISSHPGCCIAHIQAPQTVVVSGPSEDIVEIHSFAQDNGIPCGLPDMQYGLHSAQMDPILCDFEELVNSVPFFKPHTPILSSLQARVVTDGDTFSASYLVRQMREPVNFDKALETLDSAKLLDTTSLCIEIGPERVLCRVLETVLNLPRDCLFHLMDEKDEAWRSIGTAVAACWQNGVDINWLNFHREFSRRLRFIDIFIDRSDYKPSAMHHLPVQPNITHVSPKTVIPATTGSPARGIQGAATITNSDVVPGPVLGLQTADVCIYTMLKSAGVTWQTLAENPKVSEIGFDSLDWIELIAELKNSLGVEIPASFFFKFPRILCLRQAIAEIPLREQLRQSRPSAPIKAADNVYMQPEDSTTPKSEIAQANYTILAHGNYSTTNAPIRLAARQRADMIIDEKIKNYHCDFFLMQGTPDSNEIALFFLPEVTGYPAVLMKLPALFAGNNPVYTCKSPLLHVAEGIEVACTVEDLSRSYAEGIQRTQPHGPYLLAGYSIGAAYAYEVAKILADAGEIVQGLLFVDWNMTASVAEQHKQRKPVPANLSIDVMEEIGWLNGFHNEEKNFHMLPAPDKVKFHALSVFKSLVQYRPRPMTRSQRPRNTYALWAGAGIEELLGQHGSGYLPDFGIIDWQIKSRKEANGPAGWENYIGGPLNCATVPSDHLSMMISTDWVNFL